MSNQSNVIWKNRVEANFSDILLALREGMRPMQCFFDSSRDNLPFFGNQMAPEDNFGNSHHTSFSAAHIPGRWLSALLHAESVTGIEPSPQAIENLRKWAFASLECANIGFPACMDSEYKSFIKA